MRLTTAVSVHDEASDEQLASLASNDRQAFAELYSRHLDGVFRYVRYQATTSEEAKDLTAQVFFHAYRAADQFRGNGSTYRSWLFRIAHNTVASHFRGVSRLPLPVADLPEKPDPSADPAENAVDRDTRAVLRLVVGELAFQDRELIELRYVEGMAPAEIAKITGSTDGAIRVRLHRLLRRMRRLMEARGVEA